jgi:hypothetical protein
VNIFSLRERGATYDERAFIRWMLGEGRQAEAMITLTLFRLQSYTTCVEIFVISIFSFSLLLLDLMSLRFIRTFSRTLFLCHLRDLQTTESFPLERFGPHTREVEMCDISIEEIQDFLCKFSHLVSLQRAKKLNMVAGMEKKRRVEGKNEKNFNFPVRA